MGDAVVDAELHHLGVHHDQLHVLRFGLEDNTHDQRVDTHGFTGAGGARDQKVGHLADVRHHHLAADVLTHRKGQTGLVVLEIVGLQQFPQINHVVFLVRHLDAHGGFAGDGGLDADVRGCQVQLDVVGQTHDLADLHALLRQQLVAGHRRSAADIGHGHAHAEVAQGLLQFDGRGLVFVLGKCACVAVPAL